MEKGYGTSLCNTYDGRDVSIMMRHCRSNVPNTLRKISYTGVEADTELIGQKRCYLGKKKGVGKCGRPRVSHQKSMASRHNKCLIELFHNSCRSFHTQMDALLSIVYRSSYTITRNVNHPEHY
ncbi:hypothetical protein Smp_025180 [Schistosoma mansoni]|uniref:hypothetical protein n=1 Tax=Schistosoma mansoni TaxID=6183 RepID=UPI0001A63BAD|nr:hypothetical protein Smp_025180 [Schistosoma mansoni]|eukprot:XP_018654973.1 hypothetical protein Smp_025180 [Schistosoma mansoni]